jgi:DNA-binding beta-propeller fold protein YncE
MNWQQVFKADTATQTILGSVTVGKRPWGIAFSPDAKTLYSATGPSNNSSVVNLADNHNGRNDSGRDWAMGA